MKHLFTSILILSILLIISPVYAVEKASEERLDDVVQRGVHVMPFDLELTTHIFSQTAKGGIQKVIVKNPDNFEQIKLIREHLTKISHEFQQGNFSDPAKIHGDTMPGLKELRKAKINQINIVYKGLPDGARITYSTNEPTLITAIHQWFEAQLSDHARHAISGHSSHKMHKK
ncbi:MAG: aspartate carbamoyltransferase [Methylococcales symbiont of Iophon sp. n. MRB-2018]|nr:MAG: aspartate carbamoyltransferase [Methylococcales symbiont of Iophon sp. n. MRB-2018]